MSFQRSVPFNNLLLKGLPRADFSRIVGMGTRLVLEAGTALCERGERTDQVYFPAEGAISLVSAVKGRPAQEVNLIGHEGMLGATLLLGVNAAPCRAQVKWTGSVLRLTAAQFRRELEGSVGLRRVVGQYVYVLLSQSAQAVICASHHDVDARLARVLLVSHDRAGSDHFFLTQQAIAEALGVQRSAVTIAAGKLQRAHLISYRRGDISILSRKGLEAMVCECYSLMVEAYRAVLTPQA